MNVATELQRVGRVRCLAVLLSVSAIGVFPGCEGGETPAEADRPILLIGVDGLEWKTMIPLLRDNRLPNLASLMERGSYGLLETFAPARSPVVWTSIATGKEKEHHGIQAFYLESENGEKRLYRNSDRKAAALWNIASAYGRTVSVVGWWMTYPVDSVRGVMVAQTNTLDQLNTVHGQHVWKGVLLEASPSQVHPPERQEEFLAILEQTDGRIDALMKEVFGTFPHELSGLGMTLWSNCQWAFRADATYQHIALQLLRERRSDLSMVYFGGPDVVGHRFTRYTEPQLYVDRPPAEQIRNFTSVIADYYAYIDRCIGELMEAAGSNVTVIVVSDHGMHPSNLQGRFPQDAPPENVNSGNHQDGPPGVLIAAGPPVRQIAVGGSARDVRRANLEKVGSVFDVTPTVLAWMGLPAGADMQGKFMESISAADFAPPEKVDTHDTPEFFRNIPSHPLDGLGEQERLDQLKALGYLADQ